MIYDISKHNLEDYYKLCFKYIKNEAGKPKKEKMTYASIITNEIDRGIIPNKTTRFSASEYYKQYIKPFFLPSKRKTKSNAILNQTSKLPKDTSSESSEDEISIPKINERAKSKPRGGSKLLISETQCNPELNKTNDLKLPELFMKKNKEKIIISLARPKIDVKKRHWEHNDSSSRSSIMSRSSCKTMIINSNGVRCTKRSS